MVASEQGVIRLPECKKPADAGFLWLSITRFQRKDRHPVDRRFAAVNQPLVGLYEMIAAKEAAMRRER